MTINLAVLNDTHIGALRSAGTTIRSAQQLRQYLLDSFEAQLAVTDCDLLINGDLFDKENIPLSDLYATFRLLRAWMDKGHKLWLSPGNHDLSKTSTTFSSFQMLAELLGYGNPQVQYIADLTEIYPGYWVLPHLPNQDLLNDRLARVPECHALYLHCNYDNNFAAQSDQSLNVSEAQARDCKAKYLIFGHEHQTRKMLDDKVWIPGNQVPSSVSDCLNCKDSTKFLLRMVDGKPELVPCLTLPYQELDWQALVPSDAKFIRITGTATAEQGSEVAQAISRYRSACPALVITNAVKMQTSDSAMDQFAESLESVQAFDVLAALLELLDPKEQAAVKELMNV